MWTVSHFVPAIHGNLPQAARLSGHLSGGMPRELRLRFEDRKPGIAILGREAQTRKEDPIQGQVYRGERRTEHNWQGTEREHFDCD